VATHGPASLLARRYAQAFVRVYDQQLTLEHIHSMHLFAQHLQQHRAAINELTHGMHDADALKVSEALTLLAHAAGMPDCSMHLLRLLARDSRLFLLEGVLLQIVGIYKKVHDIVTCEIRSAHPLDAAARTTVEEFLRRTIGKKIDIERYVIDPRLIAGIRVQGDTFLWEYSIDQRLRQARLPFIR
jgi:ATP synthase F1 delta subunit